MNDILPLSAHTGAEIHGVDLGQSLPDKTILEIRQALNEFGVIFFRDQHLDRARQRSIYNSSREKIAPPGLSCTLVVGFGGLKGDCRLVLSYKRVRPPQTPQINKRSHFAAGVLTPALTKGDIRPPLENPLILCPPQEARLT